MNNRYNFVPILILLIIGWISNKPTPLELIHSLIENYESHSSLTYDINYKFKFFSQIEDTTKITAKIDLIKTPKDSILGGYARIRFSTHESYYDTKFAYSINHEKKTIIKYPKEKHQYVFGKFIRDAIDVYFLKPSNLIYDYHDSLNHMKIFDDKLEDKEVWKLRSEFENKDDLENKWKNTWINKTNYTIAKMIASLDCQGENQYTQWDFNNVGFDLITVKDMVKRFEKIKRLYSMSDYDNKPVTKNNLLTTNTRAPNIKGILASDAKPVSLEDYGGKIVLLDFWYMDCPPCRKSIPHLNEMYRKYENQGFEVIGINSYDWNDKNLNRFPNFLSYNPIHYPIMFVDYKYPSRFKVDAYPTFYLISRKGYILYAGTGYNENNINTIDSLIQINL